VTTGPETTATDPLAQIAAMRARADAATDGPWGPHALNADRDRGFAEVDFPYHPRAIQVRQPPRRYIGGECVVNQQDAGADAAFIAAARSDMPRLLAGYEALLKAHEPVQIYAGADGCEHPRPPEPDWHGSPPQGAVDAWDAWQEEHPYGTGVDDAEAVRICMLTPDHLACRACTDLVYGQQGSDEAFVDAADCIVWPPLADALCGEAVPSEH
jgi:hypothetical protein